MIDCLNQVPTFKGEFVMPLKRFDLLSVKRWLHDK